MIHDLQYMYVYVMLCYCQHRQDVVEELWLHAEANKKLTVDLATQEIRREGCEAFG